MIQFNKNKRAQEKINQKEKKQMRNSGSVQYREYRLNKVPRQIDLLCLGEFNCGFSGFLMQYTGQFKSENQIHNIYVKRLDEKVIFLHEWKDRDELELIQEFDGLVFFVDLVHHLNNTTQTILKNLETLSAKSGINVFRIPITVVVLNGAKLSVKQFQFQKKRLQKSLSCILHPKQILYQIEKKENLNTITSKLSVFVNRIFQNDPQSIKSTWTAYWKLYGTKDILQPYWTEWQIFYLGLLQRLARNKQSQQYEKNQTKRSFLKGQSLLKKLW